MTAVLHPAEEILLAFTRALRSAGVPVTQDRAQGFLAAVALVGLGDPKGTYWAGRATLCCSPGDLERYDQVFEAWFSDRNALPRTRPAGAPATTVAELPERPPEDGVETEPADDVVPALASAVEILRHRDVAAVSAAERQRLEAMYATLRPRAPLRRTARRLAWRRGQVDASRTLRGSLRAMGEPARIAWRAPRQRPRRVVLLVDVSGSMSGYADALLRLAHRYVVTAGPGSVEVFTVGTRLTRVTQALQVRDVDRAIVAAGGTVPDWSGGTRLGETLKAFTDRWGARGLARGAVVVVLSDGWERGEPELLGAQTARLQRIAHRLVWVNPHRGKPGYQPVQQGVVAVLPHVDDFLAGHSMATFAELTEVVARA